MEGIKKGGGDSAPRLVGAGRWHGGDERSIRAPPVRDPAWQAGVGLSVAEHAARSGHEQAQATA